MQVCTLLEFHTLKFIFVRCIRNLDKRKSNADHLEGQPPLKKMVIDGPMGVMPTNSSASHMEGAVVPVTSGNSNLVSPTSSRQMQNEIISGSTSRKGKRDDQFLKRSAVLSQVWKEDLNSGKLLTSMLDLFGESMFCFIPAPELSLFL